MRPEVGLKAPATVLKRVVLPAPFGPIRPTIVPGFDGEVHLGQGLYPAEGLADVLTFQ